MTKKDMAAVIPHAEIYARAIRTVEQELAVWTAKSERLGEDFSDIIAPLEAKLAALKALYRFETGTEY